MINVCLGRDARFGVVLIKEGQEVGEPASPHSVGTTAHITSVSRQGEGRMNLMTMGERRFTVEQVTQWEPYLKGQVRYIDPEAVGEPEPSQETIETLRATLEQYLRALLGLHSGWVREVNSPTEPVTLSFFIATVLREDNDTLQGVLEAPTAVERLNLLSPLLAEASQRARVEMERRIGGERARLN